MDVSERTVSRAKRVKRSAIPELWWLIEDGFLKMAKAERVSQWSKEDQAGFVAAQWADDEQAHAMAKRRIEDPEA